MNIYQGVSSPCFRSFCIRTFHAIFFIAWLADGDSMIPWCVTLSWWEGRLLRCSLHFLCEDLCFTWSFFPVGRIRHHFALSFIFVIQVFANCSDITLFMYAEDELLPIAIWLRVYMNSPSLTSVGASNLTGEPSGFIWIYFTVFVKRNAQLMHYFLVAPGWEEIKKAPK